MFASGKWFPDKDLWMIRRLREARNLASAVQKALEPKQASPPK